MSAVDSLEGGFAPPCSMYCASAASKTIAATMASIEAGDSFSLRRLLVMMSIDSFLEDVKDANNAWTVSYTTFTSHLRFLHDGYVIIRLLYTEEVTSDVSGT